MSANLKITSKPVKLGTQTTTVYIVVDENGNELYNAIDWADSGGYQDGKRLCEKFIKNHSVQESK